VNIIECVAGADRVEDMQLTRSNQEPAGFGPGATLSAAVWAGDTTAAIFTPAVLWVDGDPSAGKVRITFARSDTAIAAGDYTVMLSITANGLIRTRPVALLRILPAPGSQVAGKTYCTAQDVLDAVPWLALVQAPEERAGFAEAREKATRWLDALILAKRPVLDADWLQFELDNDGLVLTNPQGRRLVEAVALMAASKLLETQVGTFGDTDYRDLAKELAREARGIVAACIATVAGLQIRLSGFRVGRA
jgi:hypothetical protein